MKTRPGDVHSTVRYVYCLLPEKARQALRWMKRSLSGVFVTPSG
jgi:hypothetical protein